MSIAQRVYAQEFKKAHRGHRQRRSAVIDTQQQQHSKRFIQSLKDKEINDKINLFIERKFDYNETDVENACSCFQNLLLQAASKSINLTKSSTKIKKKSNKWYDEELYVKRRLLNSKASLMFKQPFNTSLRNSYFKHYREYRKLLKIKGKITQKIFLLNLIIWKAMTLKQIGIWLIP